MATAFDIADLVDDLEPVKVLTPRKPLLIAAAVTGKIDVRTKH